MDNPYLIQGTGIDTPAVLKNKLGITDAAELSKKDDQMTSIRMGQLAKDPNQGKFDLKHLKDIHQHIFQDLYDWAGKQREFQTERSGHRFEWPENIEKQANKLLSKLEGENYLKGTDKSEFIERAADYYGELNVLHPFPDGNGRAQRVFFDDLAEKQDLSFRGIRKLKTSL